MAPPAPYSTLDTGSSLVRMPNSPATLSYNDRSAFYEKDMSDVRGGPCLSPLREIGERDTFHDLDAMMDWEGLGDSQLKYTGSVPDMAFCDEALKSREAAEAADRAAKVERARAKEVEARAKAKKIEKGKVVAEAEKEAKKVKEREARERRKEREVRKEKERRDRDMKNEKERKDRDSKKEKDSARRERKAKEARKEREAIEKEKDVKKEREVKKERDRDGKVKKEGRDASLDARDKSKREGTGREIKAERDGLKLKTPVTSTGKASSSKTVIESGPEATDVKKPKSSEMLAPSDQGIPKSASFTPVKAGRKGDGNDSSKPEQGEKHVLSRRSSEDDGRARGGDLAERESRRPRGRDAKDSEADFRRDGRDHDMGRDSRERDRDPRDWDRESTRERDRKASYEYYERRGERAPDRDYRDGRDYRERPRGEYRDERDRDREYDRHRKGSYEKDEYYRQGRENGNYHRLSQNQGPGPQPPGGQSARTPSSSSRDHVRKRPRTAGHTYSSDGLNGHSGAPGASSSPYEGSAALPLQKKPRINPPVGPIWKPQSLRDIREARSLYRGLFEKAKKEYQRRLTESGGKVATDMIDIAKTAASACFNLAQVIEMQCRIVRPRRETEEKAELKALYKEAASFYEYLAHNFCMKRRTEMQNHQLPEHYTWFVRVQSKARLCLMDMNRMRNRTAKVEVAAVQQFLLDAVAKKSKVEVTPDMLKSLQTIVDRDQQRSKLCEETIGTGVVSEMPGYETLVDFLPYPDK